jgi:hypothetical protein
MTLSIDNDAIDICSRTVNCSETHLVLRLASSSPAHSTLMLVENFTEQELQDSPSVCRLLGEKLSGLDCITLEFLKSVKLCHRLACFSRVDEINKIDKLSFQYLFKGLQISSGLEMVEPALVARTTYLFGFVKIVRKRKDVQRKAKAAPRVNIVDFGSIEAVKLLYQGCFKVFMSVISFGVVAIPAEKIAHAIEFPR